MTTPIRSEVSRMLDAGYRATFDKWLFTQLAVARQVIDRHSAEYRTLEAISAFLRPFSAQQIVGLATPFFWFNVIRLHAADGAAEGLGAAVAGLTIATADSFLGACPVGTEYAPRVGSRAEGYCLPRTGVRLFLQPDSRLRHVGDGKLAVDGPADERNHRPRRVTLDIDGFPDIRLLLCDDDLLFDDDYRHKIFPDTPDAPALAHLIRLSLDSIGEVSPELLRRLTTTVHWYVPIHSPSTSVHNSFTASTLYGVTFLSHAYSSLRLAEAIVHEFHHDELYRLMAVEEIFEDVEGELFYSPWRDDPRPLTGLVHGLHVFANVRRFLQGALAHPSFAGLATELADECGKLAWKLQIGLRQIPPGRMRVAGLRILDDVRGAAGPISELPPTPPAALIQHMRKWQERHPGLTLRPLSPASSLLTS